MGPRVGLDVTEKKKSLLPLPGTEPQFLSRPALSLIATDPYKGIFFFSISHLPVPSCSLLILMGPQHVHITPQSPVRNDLENDSFLNSPSSIPTGQDRVYLLSSLSSGPELLLSTLKMEAAFSSADRTTCGHNREDHSLLNDVTFCSICKFTPDRFRISIPHFVWLSVANRNGRLSL